VIDRYLPWSLETVGQLRSSRFPHSIRRIRTVAWASRARILQGWMQTYPLVKIKRHLILICLSIQLQEKISHNEVITAWKNKIFSLESISQKTFRY
jgi:hypothetical protein